MPKLFVRLLEKFGLFGSWGLTVWFGGVSGLRWWCKGCKSKRCVRGGVEDVQEVEVV